MSIVLLKQVSEGSEPARDLISLADSEVSVSSDALSGSDGCALSSLKRRAVIAIAVRKKPASDVSSTLRCINQPSGTQTRY